MSLLQTVEFITYPLVAKGRTQSSFAQGRQIQHAKYEYVYTTIRLVYVSLILIIIAFEACHISCTNDNYLYCISYIRNFDIHIPHLWFNY